MRRRGKRRGALARCVAGGTARERGHVEALAIAVEGDAVRALAAIAEHLVEFPRDAMVLSPATGVYGLIGFSGRQDRNEALAALLDPLAGAYGEDWWFLGAHGFALTEARGWAAGAPLVERSLALSPRNAHGAHAWAHVLYERGDEAGRCRLRRRMAARLSARGPAPLPSVVAPGALRAGARSARPRVGRSTSRASGRAWRCRRRCPRWPTEPHCCGAASWRGRSIAPIHWKEVAAFAARSFPKIGIGFADAHCAVAYAAAGEREALERWIAELRIADAEGRLASGSALPMVAEAFGAFARGDYDEAIRLLEPAVDRFVRIGGSRAQRDLFENTLLAAYWRSGRGAAAAGLLERRLDRCPTVPRPRGA